MHARIPTNLTDSNIESELDNIYRGFVYPNKITTIADSCLTWDQHDIDIDIVGVYQNRGAPQSSLLTI